MEKRYFENRKFKLWFYHMSHGEAVIRSPKNMHFENNIDIYFGDIQYIEMPTTMLELSLVEATESDMMYLAKKIGKSVQSNNITVLLSGKCRFYIVSSVFSIIENSLEFNELPIATFIKGK